MKATSTYLFDKKFETTKEKGNANSQTNKNKTHRDLVLNEVNDLLRWAYEQNKTN